MIKVYYRKGATLGFVFHLFHQNHFVNDYKTHASKGAAYNYFMDSKIDIIMLNMERFIAPFVDDIECKNKLQLDAEERLRSCIVWISNNRDSYNRIIKNVLKCEKFMVTLVNSIASEEEKGDTLMQCRLLIDFLTEEAKNHAKSVSRP